MQARPRAETEQVKNVSNWLSCNAINKLERCFIHEHAGDLVAIKARTQTPLGRLLAKWSAFRFSTLFKSPNEAGVRESSPCTQYSSNDKFDAVIAAIIIVVGLGMLLGPLWWLEFVDNSDKRLGVITGFCCVFALLMTMATINRPFEVVAATAAYAAVLMVFMQIGGGRS